MTRTNPAGYSGTPLPKKLGIKEGFTVALTDAPDDFAKTLGELPPDVKFNTGHATSRNLAMWFVTSLKSLNAAIAKHAATAAKFDTPIWICWPKKASGVQTDVTEDRIRDAALPIGLVDYKVCAIDATWSGLLLRMRKT